MIRASLLTAILLVTVGPDTTAQTKKADRAKGNKPRSASLTRISPFDLLRYAGIREELKLTAAQETRWTDCMEKLKRFRENSRKAFEELGAEPEPEVRAAFNERLGEARLALEQETEAAMLKALDGGQRRRLEQLGLQREGSGAFLRPDIRERLNLDPGQIEAIRTIHVGAWQRVQEAREVPLELRQKALIPPEPGSKIIKIDPKYQSEFLAAEVKGIAASYKVRAALEEESLRLLTKKQRQVYRAMCGEPFDFASMEQKMVPKPKAALKAP